MGDRAYTTVLAWPYPGREQLSDDVVAALERHGALPDTDARADATYVGDEGAVVLAGDARSGAILAIVDFEANDGTSAYRELIGALTNVGMSVYAGNEAGGDYGAAWEYHQPGDAAANPEVRRADRGEFVIAASDLLGPCDTTLDSVSDRDLAARARRLLRHPAAIPEAVLPAAL